MNQGRFRITIGSRKGQFFGTGIGSEKTGNSDFKADTDLECNRKVGHLNRQLCVKYLQRYDTKSRSFRQQSADFSSFFGTIAEMNGLATNLE